ncbi:Uncharacterized protein Rs2_39040 [Raphanus sativus]|nr:Uncharacterized protein Rs2_39040 [Raphanus sativus]
MLKLGLGLQKLENLVVTARWLYEKNGEDVSKFPTPCCSHLPNSLYFIVMNDMNNNVSKYSHKEYSYLLGSKGHDMNLMSPKVKKVPRSEDEPRDNTKNGVRASETLLLLSCHKRKQRNRYVNQQNSIV